MADKKSLSDLAELTQDVSETPAAEAPAPGRPVLIATVHYAAETPVLDTEGPAEWVSAVVSRYRDIVIRVEPALKPLRRMALPAS